MYFYVFFFMYFLCILQKRKEKPQFQSKNDKFLHFLNEQSGSLYLLFYETLFRVLSFFLSTLPLLVVIVLPKKKIRKILSIKNKTFFNLKNQKKKKKRKSKPKNKASFQVVATLLLSKYPEL